MKKSITLSAISIENLKTPNYHIFLYKVLILFCYLRDTNNETTFEKEESIDILKLLCLTNNTKEYQANT